MKLKLLIQLSCFVLLSAPVKAETISAIDRQFLLDLDQTAMSEAALGSLALQRATDSNVKGYADQMILNFSRANKSLKEMALKMGESVPSSLDDKHSQVIKEFKNLDNSKFDSSYIHQMIEDHTKALAVLKKELLVGENASLKDWVKGNLPMLEVHLKMAQMLEKEQTKAK